MNPEIRRYGWLDLTQTRLIVAPAAFGFVILSIFSNQGPDKLAIWINSFLGVIAIWGMGQASLSVTEEVAGGTWDWQRLSPQSAASLAAGKVIGAPIFQWYCFLICALGYGFFTEDEEIARWVYRWTISLVILFSFAAMNSIESARTMRAMRRPTNRFARGIIFFFLLASVFSGVFSGVIRRAGVRGRLLSDESILWWGIPVPLFTFVDFSLLVFALWAMFGCYRAMKAELLFQVAPWFWLAFLAFLTFYLAPLATGEPTMSRFCAVLFTVSAAGTYLNLFRENKDIVSFRRLLARNPGRHFPSHLIPCWLATLPLMAISLFGIYIFPPDFDENLSDPAQLRIAATVAALYIIRDGALLLSLHLRNPRHPRNDMAFVFYLIMLYGILPSCLRLFHSPLRHLFWPFSGGRTFGWSAVLWSIPLAAAALILLQQSFIAALRRSSSAEGTGPPAPT